MRKISVGLWHWPSCEPSNDSCQLAFERSWLQCSGFPIYFYAMRVKRNAQWQEGAILSFLTTQFYTGLSQFQLYMVVVLSFWIHSSLKCRRLTSSANTTELVHQAPLRPTIHSDGRWLSGANTMENWYKGKNSSWCKGKDACLCGATSSTQARWAPAVTPNNNTTACSLSRRVPVYSCIDIASGTKVGSSIHPCHWGRLACTVLSSAAS